MFGKIIVTSYRCHENRTCTHCERFVWITIFCRETFLKINRITRQIGCGREPSIHVQNLFEERFLFGKSSWRQSWNCEKYFTKLFPIASTRFFGSVKKCFLTDDKEFWKRQYYTVLTFINISFPNKYEVVH